MSKAQESCHLRPCQALHGARTSGLRSRQQHACPEVPHPQAPPLAHCRASLSSDQQKAVARKNLSSSTLLAVLYTIKGCTTVLIRLLCYAVLTCEHEVYLCIP